MRLREWRGETLAVPQPRSGTKPMHLLGDSTGLKLGGIVSLEAVLHAFYEGLQLATILCCVGAANALGHIKFNFPNKFQVYLHDTPEKRLFAFSILYLMALFAALLVEVRVSQALTPRATTFTPISR